MVLRAGAEQQQRAGAHRQVHVGAAHHRLVSRRRIAVVRRRHLRVSPPLELAKLARRLLSQVRQLGHQFSWQCPVVALINIRINMPSKIQ